MPNAKADVVDLVEDRQRVATYGPVIVRDPDQEVFTVVWQGACPACNAEHQMVSRVAVEGYVPDVDVKCFNCFNEMTIHGARVDGD
jgi:hypothetical protein